MEDYNYYKILDSEGELIDVLAEKCMYVRVDEQEYLECLRVMEMMENENSNK